MATTKSGTYVTESILNQILEQVADGYGLKQAVREVLGTEKLESKYCSVNRKLHTLEWKSAFEAAKREGTKAAERRQVGQTDDETFEQDNDDMPEINAQATESAESAEPTVESTEPTVAPADEQVAATEPVETTTKESAMPAESTFDIESLKSALLAQLKASVSVDFSSAKSVDALEQAHTNEFKKLDERYSSLYQLLIDTLYNERLQVRADLEAAREAAATELAKVSQIKVINGMYTSASDTLSQLVIDRNNLLALIKECGSSDLLVNAVADLDKRINAQQALVAHYAKLISEAGGSNDGGQSVDTPAAPVQPNDGGTAAASSKSDDVAPQATEYAPVATEPAGLVNAVNTVPKATAPSHDVAEHSPKLVDAVTIRSRKRRSSASGDAAPAVEKATAPSDDELAERRHSTWTDLKAKLAEFEEAKSSPSELQAMAFGIVLDKFADAVAFAVTDATGVEHYVQAVPSNRANSDSNFELVSVASKSTVLKFSYNGGDGVRVSSKGAINADIQQLGITDTDSFRKFLANNGVELIEGRFLTK